MTIVKPCAIDTLNPLINGLIQQRDALVSVENVFSVDDPTMNALLRAKVERKVREIAVALSTWTAAEDQ